MKLHNIFHNDLPSNITFKGSIAIDTESLGLNITRDRLCLAQISDADQNVYFIKFDGKDYSAPNFRKILEDQSILKIFHYARFDVATLSHYLNIPTITPIFCTKIASKLVRTYTDAHGLKALCRELLGVELEKESQTSYWAAEKLTEKQKRYAANDVLFLHQIKEVLSQRLQELGREEIAQSFFDIINTVCKCDTIGFDSALILNHH
ncbi:MAG: ribonuclease D [Proteobacteria bacterium]|jgi:ribonuclease D|nr:ribonuclease D [Pseudomonadota bacterium]